MAARKKKQIPPASTTDKDPAVELSKMEQLNIDQLITQAISRHKDEVAVDKKRKFKEMSHLASLAEEYLSCFLLIGYSIQDEKVILQSISNAKDEAALMDLLRSTFLDLAGNRP